MMPKPTEPEDETQEEPEEEEETRTPASGSQPTVSKADAVRASLAEGIESPGDAVEFLKSRFGIDMTRQVSSSYKAQQKAREQKKSGGEEPARKPRGTTAATHSKPTASADMFDDLTAIKHLVERLGAEQVRKIVGLFE
jgi:hypothetical protein